MKRPRRPADRPLAPVLAVLSALGLATAAAAGTSLVVNRMVIVAATGTPAENCQGLRDALGAITGTAAAPYVVHLEPGRYGCGGEPLLMKPFVDLEGSGRELTRIELDSGSLALKSPSELRHLTVVSEPAAAGGGAQIALWATDGGEPRVSHVRVEAAGGSYTAGLHQNSDTSPILTDVEILVSPGAGSSAGIAALTAAGWLDGVRIVVTGFSTQADGAGIDSGGPDTDGAITRWRIRNTTIEVRGHQQTAGIRLGDDPAAAVIEDTRVEVANGSVRNWALQLYNSPAIVRRSVLSSGGTGAHHDAIHASGAVFGTLTHELLVTHCQLVGPTHTHHNDVDYLTRIGGTLLSGGAVESTFGSVTCAGVWDESLAFSAGTCP